VARPHTEHPTVLTAEPRGAVVAHCETNTGGKFLTRGEPVTTLEGEEYNMAQVQAWFADPAYQEAMAFRHAASTMQLLVVQEGGANTEDPNPNL
jgi:uncharacterized protein (DUF1330 family)